MWESQCSTDVGLMLAQRLRRWANIYCFMFCSSKGSSSCSDTSLQHVYNMLSFLSSFY